MSDEIFAVNDNADKAVTQDQQKTAEDRLRDKDDFIEQLKAENAKMREVVGQVEELKNELKSLKEHATKPEARENTTPALSEADIRAIVSKTVTETEAIRSQEQNIKLAQGNVIAAQGSVEKAKEFMAKKSEELGLTPARLREIGAESPTALMQILGLKNELAQPAGTGTTFVQGTVNADALKAVKPVEHKPGTFEYFRNLQNTDPKTFFSPKVQQQIMKAAKAGTYIIPD